MRKALRPHLEGHDAVISAAPFDGTDPRTLIAAVRASGVLPACRHQLRERSTGSISAGLRRVWFRVGQPYALIGQYPDKGRLEGAIRYAYKEAV